MDTVENYLNISINHLCFNQYGWFKELVNAVGGIEVNNNLTFSQDGYDFTIGKISLDGGTSTLLFKNALRDPMVTTAAKNVKEK